jgi:Zn-dependent alcohol dehydrogenase
VVLFKGKMFGMTDFVNPKDHEEPVEQVLMKMTNGGVDHALECCGIPSCVVLTN